VFKTQEKLISQVLTQYKDEKLISQVLTQHKDPVCAWSSWVSWQQGR
jgi:hypothetical protein